MAILLLLVVHVLYSHAIPQSSHPSVFRRIISFRLQHRFSPPLLYPIPASILVWYFRTFRSWHSHHNCPIPQLKCVNLLLRFFFMHTCATLILVGNYNVVTCLTFVSSLIPLSLHIVLNIYAKDQHVYRWYIGNSLTFSSFIFIFGFGTIIMCDKWVTPDKCIQAVGPRPYSYSFSFSPLETISTSLWASFTNPVGTVCFQSCQLAVRICSYLPGVCRYISVYSYYINLYARTLPLGQNIFSCTTGKNRVFKLPCCVIFSNA